MVAMTRAPAVALAALAAWTLSSACLSSCLALPHYEPPPSALSYAEDSGGATVAAEGFVLHFAGGTGFHFPDVLAIDGVNTLGRDATAPCYAEDGVGLVLYPTPRISANTSAAVTTSQLTATMRGPAVVQVRIDWSSQFTCSNNHPGGSSLYTVFLDGRIVRYDALDEYSMADTSSPACACDPREHQGFQIESFWTFNPTKFATVSVPGGGTAGAVPLPTDPNAPFQSQNFYVACLDSGPYQVGVAWAHASGTGMPKILISPTQAAFTRERTGGFVSTLDPLRWDTNNAVFIEHAGCKKAIDRANEHASASSLAVNGAPTMVSQINGIYGGDPASDGKPGVHVAPGHVELAGPVNGSFAVWLRFTSSVDGVRAQLAGKTGAWYVLQRIDDTGWIAWFRDPLTTGETIAIETN
jgi:hypothetical protein